METVGSVGCAKINKMRSSGYAYPLLAYSTKDEFVIWGKPHFRNCFSKANTTAIWKPDMSENETPKTDSRDEYFSYSQTNDEYVRTLPDVQRVYQDARLVSFYLPQFHPIPENDDVWGKGFTEWTNVSRAVPQFEGHHQPHLPADLGFYDLRRPEVQVEQVKLAKKAGLSAFCFYFYWFNGHRVLDQPIQNFADNEEIDFEFCLCWANENWTRRWDGRDDDVILKQSYDAADDIAFIEHISRYLKNSKYFRVSGLPLIMVYRPALLPDMAATAKRWRDWCHEAGIGPIYIAYSQSFEKVDPAKYGLDGAVQFPPNDARWTEENIASYKGAVNLYNPNYNGELYDYLDLLRRAEEFDAPSYKLFRGVFPSWDNEARRPGLGKTLLNASPAAYLKYLEAVILETKKRIAEPDEQIVFINAWNEWAEGAHLEPDRKYGMSYLEATRIASLRAHLKGQQHIGDGKLAIVVHAFYPELLQEIAVNLRDLEIPHQIFVTAPSDKEVEVKRIVEQELPAAAVLLFENRGRDVGPFLEVLRSLDLDEFTHILKLHTKRSKHIATGDTWREELLSAFTLERLRTSLKVLADNPHIGILGPSGHLLSMSAFLNRNEKTVRKLAKRMGISEIYPENDSFVAGTMFFARSTALLPIINLGIGLSDFEKEEGQINGTLAHAIERSLTYSAEAAGLIVAALVDSPEAQNNPKINTIGSKLYRYAASTG